MNVQRSITAQVDNTLEIRTESLLGKEYLVVPVVAMVEGVRFGAAQDSPELGLASEFGDTPIVWANRPLVLNHPKVDGVFVSANTPSVLEDYCFGLTMNPTLDGDKLKMEAWIDVTRVDDIGGEFEEIVELIKDQEVTVEVSVGFFSDLEKKSGKFKGQSYSGIWRNIKPDHLAILSTGIVGACSVKDGCGIPRINQEGNKMAELVTNCSCQDGADEPESEAIVTEQGDGAEPKTNKAKLKSKVKTVPSVQKTVALSDANAEDEDRTTIRQQTQALVDLAIDNQMIDSDVRKLVGKALSKKFGSGTYLFGFNQNFAIYETYNDYRGYYSYSTYKIGINVSESGVSFVGEPEEVILLTKIVAQSSAGVKTQEQEQQETQPEKENDMADPKKPETQEAAPVTTEVAPVVQETKKMTAQEYVDQAPPEVKEMLQRGMRVHDAAKKTAIDTIKANKGNKFTEQQLQSMDLDTLENMVALQAPNMSGVASPSPLQTQNRSSDTVPVVRAFTPKVANTAAA